MSFNMALRATGSGKLGESSIMITEASPWATLSKAFSTDETFDPSSQPLRFRRSATSESEAVLLPDIVIALFKGQFSILEIVRFKLKFHKLTRD